MVGIKSFSGAMIKELFDGGDGEGHLSAVSRESISPWRREAVLGWTEREKKTEKDECLECIFMHEACRSPWSRWRGSLATQGFD